MGKNLFDLTAPQKSIFITEQYFKGSSINNIGGVAFIHEVVNFDLLKKAINLVVEHNESFNIRLCMENNEIKQYIADYEPFDIEIADVLTDEELVKVENDFVKNVFDTNAKLFNFKLFRFPNGSGGFIPNLHHLISDSWTLGLIAKEVVGTYANLMDGKEPDFSTVSSYSNYIQTEKEYIESDKFNKDKAYWNSIFDTIPEPASIPVKKSGNDTFSCEANRITYTIPKEIVENIGAFCKNANVSVFNFFMAMYAIYIGRVSNLDDFVIGTPILNRTNFKEKNTMGMFINIVPYRINLQDNQTFKSFVCNIAKDSLSMLRHQKYSYQYILEDLRSKNPNLPNLYNVVMSYQITKTNLENNISYDTDWIFNGTCGDDLDIHLLDLNDTGCINIAYDYRVNKYDKEEISAIHERILHMIHQVLNNLDVCVHNIEIVTSKEKYELLYGFNLSENSKISKTVIDLFLEQVSINSNNLAISNNNMNLTYLEFNNHCNKLCNYLIDNGVKPNDKICLFLDNSIDLISSIYAVLKCGACYIPIDTSYPLDRIEYIVENSGAKCILTNDNNIHTLNFLNDMCLLVDYEKINTLPESTINYNMTSLNNLAYIIYTSGSTGKPKGVKIAHESLSNYISWANEVYVKDSPCNFPLYSSISFDLTVTTVFTPLISGNCIYIYKDDNSQLLFKKIIDDRKVHIIKLTPAHLTLLLDYITPNTLVTKLIVGGDILSTEICTKIMTLSNNKISIFNEYGPTEATVGCMIHVYSKEDEKYSSVPIGKPAKNVQLYVLDNNLNLIPFEQPGQLYISGQCLSKGYVKLEETTSKKFISSPFDKNEKLYKTGDIVVLHKNLLMEYIGRSDFQVKINGFRIEIGEIQSKILQYPNIKDCYVTTIQKNDTKSLCAYYVCDKEKSINLKQLKHYLIESLPSYMVPKYFILLDELPLTSNGKIKKDLLPEPTNNIHDVYVEPQGDLENLFSKVFCQLLNIDKISVTSNFFDYYIDSLIIIKAQTLLYSNGINVNIQNFYEYPSIRTLCNYIQSGCIKENSNDIECFPSIPSIQKKKTAQTYSYKNILLFGATGFLGIHILHNLLQTTDAHVYCIIRDKENLNAIQRFYKYFSFYFNKDELEMYENRITTITGNILERHFGLKNDIYINLGKCIDCVIDSAAIVKHYGNYDDFFKINVSGTNKIVDFCTTFNIDLHYISTLSVSGYGLVNTPNSTFTENDFYIGQNYMDNVYVQSKFEAEKLILEACNTQNLNCSIYRVGNITNRFSDGVFQKNAEDNAFLNRIISFISLKEIPTELLSLCLEFTPVDYCANFIVKLLHHFPNNVNVYHLYNQNTILLKDLISILEKFGIFIETNTLEHFGKKIIFSPDKYFGISNYLSNFKNKDIKKITLSNTLTNNVLSNLGLSWPILLDDYFEKFLNYLIKNKIIGDIYEK